MGQAATPDLISIRITAFAHKAALRLKDHVKFTVGYSVNIAFLIVGRYLNMPSQTIIMMINGSVVIFYGQVFGI